MEAATGGREQVPQVDISAFLDPAADDEARAAVAAAWDAAFRDVGFASIIGHGVDVSCIRHLHRSATAFFEQSKDEKMRWHSGKPYGTAGGYTPYGMEAVAPDGQRNSVPDLVESFVFSSGVDSPDILPSAPEDFVEAAKEYWRATAEVSMVLLRISAVALGLEEDFFVSVYSDPDSFALRLPYYPPVAAVATSEEQAGAQRYGEHTDYQGFTLLWQDPATQGVEIKLSDGSWTEIKTPEDAFVVNAGDLIELWTNARWRSTLHRVPRPSLESKDAARSRLSLVLFTGPVQDTLIVPISTCVPEGEEPRHSPVLAGDHLRQKLTASHM